MALDNYVLAVFIRAFCPWLLATSQFLEAEMMRE